MSIPTGSGNVVKVDSKGRVVLPQRVRERLGIAPGSEVEIREKDGTAVVEPEDDPEEIVEDLAELIEAATAGRDQTAYEDLDTQSRDHVDAIRRQASETSTDDE